MIRGLMAKIFGKPSRKHVSRVDTPIVAIASPVAWVSDAVWSRWMWDRQFADLTNEQEWVTFPEPRIYPATEGDLVRVHPARVPQDARLPPPGSVEAHRRLLESTPPALGVQAPSWPVCCDRLATLIHDQGTGCKVNEIEAQTGPLDRAYLEQEVRNDWCTRTAAELEQALLLGYRDELECIRRQGAADGVIFHQCRACGRVYVGSCHP